MKRTKKILSAVLALAMLALTLTACSGSAADSQSVDNIKKAGTITMYTDAAFPPFEYVEGQDIKGVDVSIGEAIAAKLGVELKVENVKFDSIVASIQSGKAAFGAAGITITDERKESVDFSQAYYTSVQYVIFKDSESFASMSDLAGKTIGVQLGTTGDFLVSDSIAGIDEDDGTHTAGVIEGTGAECKQYANGIEASLDLINGRLDAVVLDKLPAESIVNNNDGLKCVALTDAEPESYGICVAKGNESLLGVINEVLDELIAAGKIDAFVVEHSGV